MYTNNTFNSPQIFYTKRRNNSNLKAYNIKKILCLNPFNLNSKSPKDNINTNEYKNINDYSDIAYFETKQKIDLMKFKIGKFKSFLDKSNFNFNDILKNRNFKTEFEEEKKNNDYYAHLKKGLIKKEKKEKEKGKGNISDIADDLIDAFDLDNNSREVNNDNLNTQILFRNDNFFNKNNYRRNNVYNKKI
jgi:hypothetical protein